MLITSPDHPLGGRTSVAIEEAARYPAVAPPAGTFDVDGGEGLGARFLEAAHVVVEASDWTVIKHLVQEGFGVVVTPSLCLFPGDRLGRVALEGQTPACSHGFYVRGDRSLSTFARKFGEALDPGLARSGGGHSGAAARSSAKPFRDS